MDTPTNSMAGSQAGSQASQEDTLISYSSIGFPAANDDFRAARNACATACRAYNELHDDAPREEREARWHK
jgi:hypothetical protein